MTDRELLELAAKAAGYTDAEFQEYDGMEIRYGFPSGIWSSVKYEDTNSGYWNPLWDDGDALRLAVKLELDIESCGGKKYSGESFATVCVAGKEYDVDHSGDVYAAVRRAIVQAAAAIGAAQ